MKLWKQRQTEIGFGLLIATITFVLYADPEPTRTNIILAIAPILTGLYMIVMENINEILIHN